MVPALTLRWKRIVDSTVYWMFAAVYKKLRKHEYSNIVLCNAKLGAIRSYKSTYKQYKILTLICSALRWSIGRSVRVSSFSWIWSAVSRFSLLDLKIPPSSATRGQHCLETDARFFRTSLNVTFNFYPINLVIAFSEVWLLCMSRAPAQRERLYLQAEEIRRNAL